MKKSKPMKPASRLLAVTGLVLASGAIAQSAPQPAAQVPGRNAPAMPLKDGDGTISRAEAGASPRLSGRFDAIDRDQDGKLSRDELRASRTAAGQQHKGGADRRLRAADQDGDGALSKSEAENARLPGIAAHFDKADADRDGKLTMDELQASRQRQHERQAARFKAADNDGDVALTKAEAQAGKLNGLVQHFEQLDANQDGKIDASEWHAKKAKPPAQRR